MVFDESLPSTNDLAQQVSDTFSANFPAPDKATVSKAVDDQADETLHDALIVDHQEDQRSEEGEDRRPPASYPTEFLLTKSTESRKSDAAQNALASATVPPDAKPS